MDVGPMELVVVLAIVILLFGASRVGQIGGALGESVREFRRAIRPEHGGDEEATAAVAPWPSAPTEEPEAAADYVPTDATAMVTPSGASTHQDVHGSPIA